MEMVERFGYRVIVATAGLSSYWAMLFVSTHLPRIPRVNIHLSDKVLHFTAFALLAWLLVILLTTLKKLTKWHLVWIVVGCAGYAAFDELTQVPVGRTCDIFDWYADVSGTVVGLATAIMTFRSVTMLRQWLRAPKPTTQAEPLA